MQKVFLIISLIFLPVLGQAAVNKNLTEYFQTHLNNLNNSVVESENHNGRTLSSSQELWYMNQFSLRLRAPVGFEIDGFASFLVVPETEMIWQRANPDGWTNYKPTK